MAGAVYVEMNAMPPNPPRTIGDYEFLAAQNGRRCPGCTGQGTGGLCCVCGLPIPPELRRNPDDPSELPPGGAR
jgi:hypothetical protein